MLKKSVAATLALFSLSFFGLILIGIIFYTPPTRSTTAALDAPTTETDQVDETPPEDTNTDTTAKKKTTDDSATTGTTTGGSSSTTGTTGTSGGGATGGSSSGDTTGGGSSTGGDSSTGGTTSPPPDPVGCFVLVYGNLYNMDTAIGTTIGFTNKFDFPVEYIHTTTDVLCGTFSSPVDNTSIYSAEHFNSFDCNPVISNYFGGGGTTPADQSPVCAAL